MLTIDLELLKWCVVKDGGTKGAIAWLKSDVFGCEVIRGGVAMVGVSCQLDRT